LRTFTALLQTLTAETCNGDAGSSDQGQHSDQTSQSSDAEASVSVADEVKPVDGRGSAEVIQMTLHHQEVPTEITQTLAPILRSRVTVKNYNAKSSTTHLQKII
jgi:hypothetical protein